MAEKDNTCAVLGLGIALILLLVVLLQSSSDTQALMPTFASEAITSFQVRLGIIENNQGGMAQHEAEQDPPTVPRLYGQREAEGDSPYLR